MDKITRLLTQAQNLKSSEEKDSMRCFRPWISHNEKTGFTVTVYYADNFLELIHKNLEGNREYLESHIAGQEVFESYEGIKAYIDGIVKGRKPCFIGGEYDREENRELVAEALRSTGYAIL